MPQRTFIIDDFGFASFKVSSDQKGLIRDFARTIQLGQDPIPPISGVSKVVVVGHAKGTKNLDKHANRRRDAVVKPLIDNMKAFGATVDDTGKVMLGDPITFKVPSNSHVTGKDRKVTIRIEWKPKPKLPKDDPQTIWARHYFSRQALNGWESIGSQSFFSSLLKKKVNKKVWVGPEELWRREMQSAPIVETYLENYAGLLHFAPIQGVPNMKNPGIDKRNFKNKFKGKLDRRIRLFEMEEFLTALYTAEPEFGSGPTLRTLRFALAKVIERFQGGVIVRISEDRRRPTRGLFGKEQLEPVAKGGGPVVQKAMIKNALCMATATLLAVNRSQTLKSAKSTAKNCGTIVGFAVREHSRLLRKDERIASAVLNVVFTPLAVEGAGGKIVASIVTTSIRSAVGSLIKAGSIGLDRIKTEFERQANFLEDKKENPKLTNAAKTEIVQEFRDGCDTVFEP